MDLLFSFDSEDYLTPQAADAEKWWADELTSRSIKGTFQCVGEFIRSLQRRDRYDVIDAIAHHDIGHHTDYHSPSPTHPEALEGKSLSEGVAYVMRTEAPAFRTLYEAFGRTPISYVPPGDSWTPATVIAMATAGIRVFCNEHFPHIHHDPYWYCGMLVARYNIAFDAYYAPDSQEEEAFKADFDNIAGNTTDSGAMIVFTHPTRLVTSQFWDVPFMGGRRIPVHRCPPAPLWPETHVQELKDRCRRWLDWIQARPDVRIIDMPTLYAERPDNRHTLTHLLDMAGLKPGQEGDMLDALPVEPDSPAVRALNNMEYVWPIHPKGFAGTQLCEQAQQLAWTFATSKPGTRE